MKSIYTVILFVGILWSFVSCGGYSELSKEALTQNINDWYASIGDEYRLELGSEVTAKITRYHPERPEEKDDLIKITYKGMVIQLAFNKPLAEISTHKDSLEKYFSYISVDKIYNEISAEGWKAYPRTPQSSLRGEGVLFTGDEGVFGFQVNWSIYNVLCYSESKECKEALSMTDIPSSEACYVSIRKRIPLKIVVSGLSLD